MNIDRHASVGVRLRECLLCFETRDKLRIGECLGLLDFELDMLLNIFNWLPVLFLHRGVGVSCPAHRKSSNLMVCP